MIKKLIKFAAGLVTTDTGDYRRTGISYQGISNKQAVDLTPYGFFHNTPEGGLALVFAQNGQESNPVVIMDDPKNRFKNTSEGETGLYNQLTEDLIHLRADGSILLKVSGSTMVFENGTLTVSNANVIVTSGDVIADGISLKTHTHGGVQSGGDNTGTPN